MVVQDVDGQFEHLHIDGVVSRELATQYCTQNVNACEPGGDVRGRKMDDHFENLGLDVVGERVNCVDGFLG